MALIGAGAIKAGLAHPSWQDWLGSPMPRQSKQTAKPAPIPPATGQGRGSMTPKARKAKLAWLKGRQARRARWKAKRWGSLKGLMQRA